MRSWKPRQPSARVKAALFGGEPEPAATTRENAGGLTARWFWLTPVMGCFLLFIGLSTRNEHLGARADEAGLTPMMESETYAAYIRASFHSDQNGLQTERMEWTNAAIVSSERPFFSFVGTNILKN